MRIIKWRCETGYVGCDIEGEIEVDDDATEKTIDSMVEQEVFNCISWGWWEEDE